MGIANALSSVNRGENERMRPSRIGRSIFDAGRTPVEKDAFASDFERIEGKDEGGEHGVPGRKSDTE